MVIYRPSVKARWYQQTIFSHCRVAVDSHFVLMTAYKSISTVDTYIVMTVAISRTLVGDKEVGMYFSMRRAVWFLSVHEMAQALGPAKACFMS